MPVRFTSEVQHLLLWQVVWERDIDTLICGNAARFAVFLQFAIRRFARLWPTMLLCASLTFGVLSLWPNVWAAQWGNFLPSLSLISPKLWNAALPGVE
ncbi:hypothetical protein [Cohaesibacter gelatinilyticus]|uniref:hypothetical protein n=1 Tax=Cohaesibacter gelatinilyticus TaxID=372072 RepID=UPI001144851C|nr:hypothetical protein [Cohaesibacter gelatinilyticus]